MNPNGFGASVPEIYYGGFANALAYRLGQDQSTTPPTPTQIPESGVTITASTLDSTGAEILPGKTIYKDTTGADGRATMVAVITGDNNGNTFDSHIVRASGLLVLVKHTLHWQTEHLLHLWSSLMEHYRPQCHLPTLEHILSAHTLTLD